MSPKIPPVIVVAAFALLMWLLDRYLPILAIGFPGVRIIAALLALAGIAVCAAGVTAFQRAGTTTNPLDPALATRLVVRGVYRVSRNPMYLGFALLLLAWALFLQSLAAVLVAVLFVPYMNRFQIAPEERALETLFGEEYHAYRHSVRRWL